MNKFIPLLLVLVALFSISYAQRVGGVGEERPITPEVLKIVREVEPEARTRATFAQFVPISYASQVVAGVNYFVKVDAGNGQFVHLRIYKGFSDETQLVALKTGLTADDELTYFS
eukprot:TRINITY_DN585_c0_g1_i1.p1 TRINITY_DN585_c0_g1~~TRINITY_DN585_c0_g1_i1.p1  ORF type:complete len:115 (-),score=23.47 TRINITY_DN585_c0_g1_i1:98-442(-)